MQLTITELSKTYPGGFKALDGLRLEIGPGMFGLLGPNGAGKSTLMRIIATLQQPDAGASLQFGDIDVCKNPMALRQILGYLPQEFGVYPGVSAEVLLDYLAQLKGLSDGARRQRRIAEVLELTNLYHDRRQPVDRFSGGMKQRFGIAQLLLNNPRLIIVDEPTAGLDPAERIRFLHLLRELSTDCTVLFSTHIVEDVRDLCTDMAILNRGKIWLHDSPAHAIQQLAGRIWVRTLPPDKLAACQALYQPLSVHYQADGILSIRVYAHEKPGSLFVQAEPLLDDVYFQVLAQAQEVATPIP